MIVFNRYSIQSRLAISALLGFIGMLLIAAQSLVQTNTILLSEKHKQMQYLVEAVHSQINANYQKFTAGELSETQAKQAVIASINLIRYDDDNYFWINDKDATIIVHPIKPALNGKNLSSLQDANGKRIFPAFVKKAQQNSNGGIVDYLWPKPGHEVAIDKVSFVKEFKPWGWVVGSGIYIDDVDITLWDSIYRLLIDLAIITLLMFILSFCIAKSIIDPIKKTSHALANLAQADGDLTQRLPIVGNNEITELSLSFNEFITKIQSIIEKIQDSAHAVQRSSADLSSLSQKSLQSTQQQNAETAQIATASNEMVSTINEIANSATTAANLAEVANTEAKNSKIIVNESMLSVQNLSVEITNASAVISDLNDECNAIDSVLSVIQEIAGQTNLLALNAAIEAARAGEQGRGFAVVADEVRTLAGKTQEATQEINVIIAQLQEKAIEAVATISKSDQIVENAVTQANNSSQSLDSISNAIIEISNANHHIATAADQQSSVTREIDERVLAIADLSEQSTQRSLKINNGSEAVNKLGSKLSQLIKSFHI